jgi:hypothetical protein
VRFQGRESVDTSPEERWAGGAGMSLSGPQQKFAEGVAMGLTQTEAYMVAYPKGKRENAMGNAPRLRKRPQVAAEIARIRKAAEEVPGSAKLTLAEKRDFLARLVRAKVETLPADSDLWNSIKQTKFGMEYKLPNKLSAIILDNDLAGEGSEANAADALAGVLGRVRQ